MGHMHDNTLFPTYMVDRPRPQIISPYRWTLDFTVILWPPVVLAVLLALTICWRDQAFGFYISQVENKIFPNKTNFFLLENQIHHLVLNSI